MIHFLEHLTGMCGEPHLNLLTLFFIFILFRTIYKRKTNI
jgi:hypothetical protein